MNKKFVYQVGNNKKVIISFFLFKSEVPDIAVSGLRISEFLTRSTVTCE